MKKLTIQFWKAKQALVMQVLKKQGLPQSLEIPDVNCIELHTFKSDLERDNFFNEAIEAINNALVKELPIKVGSYCDVRNSPDESWSRREVVSILPEAYESRFLVKEQVMFSKKWESFKYARPLTRYINPSIRYLDEKGDLVTYTWEDEED